MSNPLRILSVIFLGSIVFAGAALAAGTGIIQGDVTGPDSKPVQDAKITIAMKDAKGALSSAKTDSKGHYSFKDLEHGSYTISVAASGMAPTTANDVRPRSVGPLRLDFSLKKQAGNQNTVAKKKATHMVWIPAMTGSNLGGRWVEVDDQGNSAGTENVQRAGGGTVRSIQSNSNGATRGGGN